MRRILWPNPVHISRLNAIIAAEFEVDVGAQLSGDEML